jgi:hypothetical protein
MFPNSLINKTKELSGAMMRLTLVNPDQREPNIIIHNNLIVLQSHQSLI